MEIKHITPMGYCYGVVDAMVIAKNAALDTSLPRPLYILGMIVHNEHVTRALKEAGIITVDGENRLAILDKIQTGTVIFTAHGVSDAVRQLAEAKGLVTIDASCPDVLITHEIVKSKLADNYDVIYIGKKGHPEPEGVVSIAPNRVHLVSQLSEVESLELGDKIFMTNQTTMSMWDVAEIMEAVMHKYPQVEAHSDICQATNERQQAVADQAVGCDLTLVVGDPRSNNTNRLAQVSQEQAGVPAYRIADVGDIDPAWLQHVNKVAVTAGASTPTPIVREVMDYLKHFDGTKKQSQVQASAILPKGRAHDLTTKREKRLNLLRRQANLS